MTAFPIAARLVFVGDVLTDSAGQHRRFVVERDDVSNVHGKIVLRTSVRRGGKASGSTVVSPDSTVYVMTEGNARTGLMRSYR